MKEELRAAMSAASRSMHVPRLLPIGPAYVPSSVWLATIEGEECLVWDYKEKEGDHYLVHPREHHGVIGKHVCLLEFAELADAKPKKVLAFARRWGVLEICEHDRPYYHQVAEGWSEVVGDDGQVEGPFPPRVRWCEPLSVDGRLLSGRDPLRVWYKYAREANSILRIAASLYDDEGHSRAKYWRSLAEADLAPGEKDEEWVSACIPDTIDGEWGSLAATVDGWLDAGNIRLELSSPPDESRLEIKLRPCGLFGVMALQLTFTVARANSIAFCPCGKIFFPKRKDQKYCNDACRSLFRPSSARARG